MFGKENAIIAKTNYEISCPIAHKDNANYGTNQQNLTLYSLATFSMLDHLQVTKLRKIGQFQFEFNFRREFIGILFCDIQNWR